MLNVNDDIHHVQLGDREVKDWRLRSGKILLYSKYKTEHVLRADWELFSDQNIEYQHESDWKSIELFNLPNKDRYEKMLSVFLRNDINDSLYDLQYAPIKESVEKKAPPNRNYALKEYAIASDPITEAMTYAKIKNDSILSESVKKDIKKKSHADNDVSVGITPFYTPDELVAIGTSLDPEPRVSDVSDNTMVGTITITQWINEYKNKFKGYAVDEGISQAVWKETLQKLYSDFDSIKESKDLDKINARKQSILDLGWNPEIDFNEHTLFFASKRIKKALNEQYSGYNVVNIEESVSLYSEAEYVGALREVVTRPIFIVFFNSKSFFNKLVRAVDKSVYSHVAISFDPSLKTMYSFSGTMNGFTNEGLKKRIEEGEDKAIQVFCVFVDPGRYSILHSKVSQIAHDKNMKYSFLNLITIPFKINYIDNTKMVCSQFVDAMLKLAGLDFTKIGSNMISPGKLNAKMKLRKFKGVIYKIYTGPPSKYSADRVGRFIDHLSAKEYKLEDADISPLLQISPIVEAKEFPIQFSDDGDLLISKGFNVNFEGEYSRCHMAMQQYAKAKNVEGMKYCLCKLWYLNILLEEKIHKDRNDKDKLKEYHKARAKIVNDISTYMKTIQKYDKKFDILKEYQESPFNDQTVKIKRSTLLYGIDLVKKIIGVR